MRHVGLKNTVVIVAGGTGGIGSAICRLLLRENATVIAASRSAGVSPLADWNRQGSNFIPTAVDLGRPDAWSRLVQMVEQQYGHIDVLIHSVGVLSPGGILGLSYAEVRQIVETNLLSVVFGAKAVLPGMKRRGHGLIINMGSLGGIMPMPHEELYSMTKGAIRTFSLSLDRELAGSGVRVSTISSGPVRTRMLDQEANDSMSALAFVQHPLSPESVARNVVRLMHHPRCEMILPPITGRLARSLARFSCVFAACYPLLETVGQWKRENYRVRCGMYSRESFKES